MSEETQYQQQWDKYQNEKGNGCLTAIILLPIVALSIYSARKYSEYSLQIIIGLFVIVGVSNFFLKQPKWICPRCGGDFYSRYRHKNITRADNCIDCDLPIYYGSTYFYDYWGKERGSEQMRKAKTEEKEIK